MLLVLLVVSVSCNSMLKDAYLRSFERFVEKVEKECGSYTKDDWKSKDERFTYYENKYDEFSENFTKEDKKLVVKLKMKYVYLRGKSAVGGFFEELEDFIDVGTGAFEEFYQEIIDGEKTE